MVKGKKVTQSNNQYKGLARPLEGRLLGGVCVGIGRFLDIDPVIIRLIFVGVTLLGGSGILIYIILWLIIPSEQSQDMITQKSIEDGVKEIQQKAQKLAENAKEYSQKANPRTTVGIILIILGSLLLIQNLAPIRINIIGKFWPILLIVFAIYLMGKNE
jgi:phage shock protein C